MRFLVAALLLTACSPASPPPTQPASGTESEPQAPQHPDTAALAAAPAAGQWFEGFEDGTFSAGFGLANSECQFRVICTAPAGALTLYSSHALAPDQATTMRLITATRSLELPARSVNLSLPSISAEIGDDDPLKPLLIGMLGRRPTASPSRPAARPRVSLGRRHCPHADRVPLS